MLDGPASWGGSELDNVASLNDSTACGPYRRNPLGASARGDILGPAVLGMLVCGRSVGTCEGRSRPSWVDPDGCDSVEASRWHGSSSDTLNVIDGCCCSGRLGALGVGCFELGGAFDRSRAAGAEVEWAKSL